MFHRLGKLSEDYRIKSAALCSLSIMLFISLATYNMDDPSFSTSTIEAPENFLGLYGAYISDLLLQFCGAAGYLLALFFLISALVILYKKSISYRIVRVMSLFLSIQLIATFFALFHYKMCPSGVGGYIGYFWSSYLIDIDVLIQLALLIIGIISFLYSVGLDFSDVTYLSRKLRISSNNETIHSILDSSISKKSSYPRKTPSISSPSDVNIEENESENDLANIELNTSVNNISGEYELPTIDLLGKYNNKAIEQESESVLQENASNLLKVLKDFGVKGQVMDVSQGPVVTLYELEPSAGTKSSRVIGLADDIARSLSAISTRIAVIPGRNALGVELPNKKREFFSLRDLIETAEYRNPQLNLPIILGKDLAGKPAVVDLAKMPHLLVAGTTGSGKSVAINAMIVSLLYKHSPESCKFIMIDPKMLELSVYDGIPHLLTPVVTESGKAVVALKWAVKEMENRYRLMSNLGVRNIASYNEKVMSALEKGQQLERTVQTGFDPETGKPIYESMPIEMEKLPFIVIIVDEMADLMLVAGKDIETSIQRLAQMARAAGIHLIMATQRPSVDVITGVIKANFPSRISFKVTSKIDSRTILGEQGAEQLLGMGDMLYMGSNSKITRFHGPFVDDREVENITSFLKAQGTPKYITEVTKESSSDDFSDDALDEEGDDDALYRQSIAIIKRDRKVSTSYIQRCLRIGYNRAAIIIERMENEGIVSAPSHSGKREILIPEE